MPSALKHTGLTALDDAFSSEARGGSMDSSVVNDYAGSDTSVKVLDRSLAPTRSLSEVGWHRELASSSSMRRPEEHGAARWRGLDGNSGRGCRGEDVRRGWCDRGDDHRSRTDDRERGVASTGSSCASTRTTPGGHARRDSPICLGNTVARSRSCRRRPGLDLSDWARNHVDAFVASLVPERSIGNLVRPSRSGGHGFVARSLLSFCACFTAVTHA